MAARAESSRFAIRDVAWGADCAVLVRDRRAGRARCAGDGSRVPGRFLCRRSCAVTRSSRRHQGSEPAYWARGRDVTLVPIHGPTTDLGRGRSCRSTDPPPISVGDSSRLCLRVIRVRRRSPSRSRVACTVACTVAAGGPRPAARGLAGAPATPWPASRALEIRRAASVIDRHASIAMARWPQRGAARASHRVSGWQRDPSERATSPRSRPSPRSLQTPATTLARRER